MGALSEFAWSKGVEWSSHRKLPYFYQERNSLDNLGLSRYALILWDLERFGDSHMVLQSVAEDQLGLRPVSWYVCNALLSIMCSEPKSKQEVDRLLYRLSMEEQSTNAHTLNHYVQPFLGQLVWQYESGIISTRRRQMANAVLLIIEEILLAFCSFRGNDYGFLRLLSACEKDEVALRRAVEETPEGYIREVAIANVIFSKWIFGKKYEAETILGVLNAVPGADSFSNFWRSIAAAVCSHYEMASENLLAVIRKDPDFLSEGHATRIFLAMLILKSLGFGAICESLLRRATFDSDFIEMRMCLLARIEVTKEPFDNLRSELKLS